MNKKIKFFIGIVALVLVTIFFISSCSKESGNNRISESSVAFTETTYVSYLENNEFLNEFATQEIAVDLTEYQAEDGMEVTVGETGITTSDEGSITFEFQVEEEGFYNLEVGYIAEPGTNSDIQRQMLLDGESYFDGMKQIVWKRNYEDGEIKDKNGNEIRPQSVEVYKEQIEYVSDYNRRTTEPFAFYLSKGKHTITFIVIKEPVTYTSLTFRAMEQEPTYEEWMASIENQVQPYEGELLISQAERVDGTTTKIEKSSTSITIQKNYTDAALEPYHPYKIIYNTIGKDSFSQPGDSLTWTIAVEEEGLYTLSFKLRQSVNRGTTSYRKIKVNGEVPYVEMNGVGFDYSSDMQYVTISDSQGEPYLFHLNAGENTIAMEVVLGEFGEVLTQVEESMFQLNQLYLRTIQITGEVPSRYIDYEITKKITGFASIMEEESKRLEEACNRIVEITGEKGESTAILEKMAIQAKNLSEKPDDVVEELEQLKNNVAALGTWIVSISNMPLEIDTIVLGAKEAELPKSSAGIVKNSWNGMIRFFSTFFISTSEVEVEERDDSKEPLRVWVASSGKEQAQIIQNMIDESFTPNTDIPVELQLIPADVVLRAALAGNGPDIVISLTQAMSNDFAMRGAIVDLSTLDGFEEEQNRFHESAIDSASYLDGVYGLPEQQNFMMLFYRNDILEELGAQVPETWDQVKELIPVLQMKNYDFYLPTTLYQSFVYQKGGDLYLGEGNEYGIASGLYDDTAMEAFKEYTDFYTIYKLLVSADFSNRFRTGAMPIGITNYATYCQLEIFAPEIKGLWSFAPLPGYETETGIDRSYVTETIQSVIMERTTQLEESWEFLKWWTGTEAQLQFANTVESIMGTSARYPAADLEVLSNLPWNNKEVNALMEQLTSCVGLPAIPGNYMTTRMTKYAFDTVVADYANPRETLYLNIRAIEQELQKKRIEFHLNKE